MRLLLVTVFSIWLAFATGRSVPGPSPPRALPAVNGSFEAATLPCVSSHRLRSRAFDLPFEWNKAWCKGGKLLQAMIKDEAQATPFVDPVRSKWDGDLRSPFRTWGYNEVTEEYDYLCYFGPGIKGGHNVQRAFEELGIGIESSSKGGPNQCFHIEHMNGPTVIRPPSNEMPPEDDQFYNAGGRRLKVGKSTKSYRSVYVD